MHATQYLRKVYFLHLNVNFFFCKGQTHRVFSDRASSNFSPSRRIMQLQRVICFLLLLRLLMICVYACCFLFYIVSNRRQKRGYYILHILFCMLAWLHNLCCCRGVCYGL
ncbi:hypothetical protein, unlikely [Trypanosoma brucei gambiense DAL972]|uniref:Uncharacterized protein n=1 Tax=Trypanosoma brucei gambiense (strain MHOM/CI/86/DAL972) TaxID=679716 RepID=C9ZJU2_TRYB9|nr:hypothetical protein, unlikely [Trypanosoma brucei gambiense DAL972]CBH09652.1 hypothetical protein, unlikely [Trypanosoma brucei gambiense DAL972]|eukprot:XP_011771956.1 hypothetical protein, unlikely [Trypanosoma brucei gambiense DAL972]